MIDRLSRVILDQVLFGDVGDVVALIVLGQQVVERLLLAGAAVLRNRGIPFVGIVEFRIDVENHPAKRVFAVADHLPKMIFSTCFQHVLQPLGSTTTVNTRRMSNSVVEIRGNSL